MKKIVTAETIRADYEKANYYTPNKKLHADLGKYLTARLNGLATIAFENADHVYDVVNHMTLDKCGTRTERAIRVTLILDGEVKTAWVPGNRYAWLIRQDKILEKTGAELLAAVRERLYI